MCPITTLLSSHLTTLGFSKYQQPRVNRKSDERYGHCETCSWEQAQQDGTQ